MTFFSNTLDYLSQCYSKQPEVEYTAPWILDDVVSFYRSQSKELFVCVNNPFWYGDLSSDSEISCVYTGIVEKEGVVSPLPAKEYAECLIRIGVIEKGSPQENAALSGVRKDYLQSLTTQNMVEAYKNGFQLTRIEKFMKYCSSPYEFVDISISAMYALDLHEKKLPHLKNNFPRSEQVANDFIKDNELKECIVRKGSDAGVVDMRGHRSRKLDELMKIGVECKGDTYVGEEYASTISVGGLIVWAVGNVMLMGGAALFLGSHQELGSHQAAD